MRSFPSVTREIASANGLGSGKKLARGTELIIPVKAGAARALAAGTRTAVRHQIRSGDTLHALAVMGRYPKPQKLLIELAHRLGTAFPLLAPRKYFRWSEREKQVDELHRTAAIAFVAEKRG